MYQNGYQQYKAQSVSTMTRGEMLLLLYDELLKRLTRADLALSDENYEAFEQSVTRSKEIVQYLNYTLNNAYEISQELHRLYEFFLYEISRLQASRNKQIIVELKPLVVDLRDAFSEAEKKADV